MFKFVSFSYKKKKSYKVKDTVIPEMYGS